MDLPEQQLIVQHEQRAVCVVGQGHWLIKVSALFSGRKAIFANPVTDMQTR
jgi:hypothetical protein